MRKLQKTSAVALVLALLVLGGMLTGCGLPAGYHIFTFNKPGTSPDPGIISFSLPGLVPVPLEILSGTPDSDICKVPHTLDGRIGFCLGCHSVDGPQPVPSSHIGRPQDSCTVCHLPAWEATNEGGNGK